MIFRKRTPLILCLCLCTLLSAQTSRIDRPDRFNSLDSLEQVLVSGKLSSLERADLLLELSRIYRMSDDSAKSRSYAVEALKLAIKNGLKNMEAAAYTTLGGHYLVNDKHYIAYVNFKKAEKLFLQTNDKKWLSVVYQSLMVLFKTIEDHENTEYYAEKVLEMAIERGDMKTEVLALFFLGWARYDNNTGLEALNYYRDLYHKSVQINHNYTAYIALHSGMIYVQQNRPREALQYLHWVREYCETSQVVILPEMYAFLAEAYTMLYKVDSAEFYIQKALNMNNLDNVSKLTVLRSQSLIASYKDDHQNALEFYKKYFDLSESIAHKGKTLEIARMKNWFELEQKDIEYEILQQEKLKQKRLILILTVALLLIFALLSLLILLYRKTTEKNNELKKLHAVKDKLFSVISHDLRTPLAALTSVLRFASKKTLDAEMRERFFKDISSRVDDTFSLLDNLLCWSKNQMKKIVPSPASFNIRVEIQEIIDNSQTIAQAKQISLTNLCENYIVFADRDMFAVVVRNLITNAIKYSHEEGEVKISAQVANDLKMINISVNDNGIGMSQEVQDNLFKLSKTKSVKGTNNESGTGLGLTLCADFVKMNGGVIWFNSKEGEGTTFSFSVPKNISQ
ncbi:MAG: ATP-binding protein [Marinilabiliaceae bacterium]|nr:ATP-binding protein [Marinilabiliaceae bacterium]